MKTTLFAAIASATVLAAAITSPVMAAGNANLYVTPASGSYTTGNSFSVQVHENGDAVNVVTAKLTYDAAKLSCTGVTGSSAFPNTISASCSNGSVTISNYTAPGTTVSGDNVVGTISFTAVATGSATVSVAGGSQVASNGANIWNGAANTATFSITAPATPAPTPTPTPTPTPSAGSGATRGNPSNPTPTTPAGSSSSTSTPQVEGATTTTPSDDATTSEELKTDGSTAAIKAARDAAAKNNNHVAAWTTGSVVVVLGLLAAAYFYLTRRNPALLKSVAKKINL